MIYLCMHVLKSMALNFKSPFPSIHTSLGAGAVVKGLDDHSALVLMQSTIQYLDSSQGEWTFIDDQCWARLSARAGFEQTIHVRTKLDIHCLMVLRIYC